MQFVGLWYTPRLFEDGALVENELVKARDAGFETIIAFFRWMHLNVTSDAAVAAVERDVAVAHRLGLKFMIDSDPTWWGIDVSESHPEAAQRMIRRAEGHSYAGNFSVYVPRTGAGNFHTQESYDAVVAVYAERATGWEFIDPAECGIVVETGTSPDGILNADATDSVNRFARISGKLPVGGNRRVLIYTSFRVYCYADYAHPGFKRASLALLDMYAHIPLDGVGWDEPGRTRGLRVAYRSGQGFLDFFKRTKGYDLVPNIIHLDGYSNEAQGTRIRRDYYDALAEMNLIAQAEHNEYAKKLFGDDIIVGTHQTWSPHGDYATGMGDYFRNGECINPAWVDVHMTEEEDTVKFNEMLHVYTLGDSLRKEFGFTEAVSNDYFVPFRADQIRFFMRMRMLYDISHFYLWIGEHTEWMPNSSNRHWPEVGEAVRELDSFHRCLNGEYRTLTDTAVLYSPTGLYVFASGNMDTPTELLWRMRHHICRHFLREGRGFDFVGETSLDRASVGGGYFAIDDRRYARLVLPWSGAISQSVKSKVDEMASNGVQVIFTGSPVFRIAETGEDVSEEFFARFGLDSFTAVDYLNCVRDTDLTPSQFYPFSQRAYPLTGSPRLIAESWDGEPAVVRGLGKENVIYDSSLDILNAATYANMQDTCPTGIRVHVNHGYWRVFEKKGNLGSYVLLVISGMRSPLDAIVRTDHDELVLSGGTYAAFKMDNDKISRASIIGDGKIVQ